MTSETNQPIEPTALQPLDPEPGSLPEIQTPAPSTPRRTRAIVNGVLGGFRPGPGNGRFGQLPGAGNVDPGDGGLRLGFGGMSIQGRVKAVDADSITLQPADGSTVEIAIDSDTDYHRRADASASDITTGATVFVDVNVGRRSGANPTAGDVTIVP